MADRALFTHSRSSAIALMALALFTVAYLPVWRILFEKWSASEEYNHAFLTLPIIIYMVWGKRHILLDSRPTYTTPGLLLFLFATLLYLFALLTQVHTLIALAMYLAILGITIYLLGIQALHVLAVPLILFAMLIPVPDQLYTQLTFPLQLMMSQASEVIVRLAGVTIFREGNVMHIPGKSFEMVEACSGLRSVITLMTLSVIMGYFMLRRTAGKLILFAWSIPAAILVNLVRVVTMILLYHFFNLDLTEGTLHTITGLAVFLVALLILFIVQQGLEAWETKKN